MVTAAQITPHRMSSEDFEYTQKLKAKFSTLRQTRQPFYLTAAEFEEILKWKLRNQFGRQRDYRKANTEEVIRVITQTTFSITHPDKDYELDLRIRVLCVLRGVGIPVASAVLALVLPDEYAVIDFRGWRQVFGEEKGQFSLPEYKKYLGELRGLADELGWLVQEVDLAIWEYDRVVNSGVK